ncbi:3'(2'),5'-bisphosphate nucleotidase CysQ [Candidatus Ishikawella capsulata]|uniref:3'(2'),5'-bisphosphate nucleotidase CysQ n=1 Tax=Candidatus Ishikawaella capsulata Mpkobe TaxID=476281 RepID=C5WCH4_9ENTR|nr:3'(2'),5'-bisphosphate nucleotidase CysQ [Candidatus Ishikawaella capsulata]BAH83030.1 PAPS (adenosine 3'-phosphate 5'-phosphosulfate) 3'(2'),5'-bisphosphate nucleotidase [Candidatus Ishikawaella capsulata Mpkobe]
MLRKIIQLARKAGHAIMKVYNNLDDQQIQVKSDYSPVTNADMIAHHIIVQGLKYITPEVPILSEEEPSDWSIRERWQYYWLVDPLDGTKEFIDGHGDFTVNIALIKNGNPVIGVVYAPVLDLLYFAHEKKAWKEVNKQKIKLCVVNNYPPLVLISRSHLKYNESLTNFLKKLGEHRKMIVGSSLKFCLIAEGKAQLYPRYGPTNIWDTAAGHAIAIAAGAQVCDYKGNTLNYLPNKSTLNTYFIVSSYILDKDHFVNLA